MPSTEYIFKDIEDMANFIEGFSAQKKEIAKTCKPSEKIAALSQSYAYSQAAFIVRNAMFLDVAS